MSSFHMLVFPSFRLGRLYHCRDQLRGEFEFFARMFLILIAEFVRASMIGFAVGDCRDVVCVGCQVVMFCGWIV
jgi:hypothetical protein